MHGLSLATEQAAPSAHREVCVSNAEELLIDSASESGVVVSEINLHTV